MKRSLSIIGPSPRCQFDIQGGSDGNANSTLAAGRVVVGEKEFLVA